jgi:hypothetical protein
MVTLPIYGRFLYQGILKITVPVCWIAMDCSPFVICRHFYFNVIAYLVNRSSRNSSSRYSIPVQLSLTVGRTSKQADIVKIMSCPFCTQQPHHPVQYLVGSFPLGHQRQLFCFAAFIDNGDPICIDGEAGVRCRHIVSTDQV